ncbi:carbon-nitrogen hydrolase family protein [Saxibacter everestensis]|uniref:Carbon-nitrogen hydrolase family protein n=1 Tax=Saxibacter everestensis TaxID=2909229 RepID=A0ABY8QUQ1_9MICO|nr:carbon-nitrogen hydrolase family protein [Brevibacteriaceae bacterium ZFBP1038]
MSMKLRVAVAQLSAGPDPQENLRVAQQAIRAAAGLADLVVLPEATFACFGTDLAAIAEPLDGPWATAIRKTAAEAGITAIVGTFEPSADGRVYNTLIATGGGVEAAYRKIHLYDAFGAKESETVAPGESLELIEVNGVTIGLATCFDLRFPEQFKDLARRGAQLIAVPASWGAGPNKEDQWDLLIRARAVDSTSWLVACDQSYVAPRGAHPLGVGRSAIVDPTGLAVHKLGATDGLLVAELDIEAVGAVRRRVPVL